MTSPIIEVQNISKKYKIGSAQPYYALRDVITGIFNTPIDVFRRKKSIKDNLGDDEFWALKDVSFSINKGEIVGIIGLNGAGKSTLLKILSRITPPTSGEVRLSGRVASLLEVGTGFHPELTGRENIFLNGSILGMRRWEIKKKFNEIVEFAEIEKFLDTPVKHYSSGMYMRLAFSVAAHLEPEILLVDEVLAVGDANFQKKSLGKMEEVTRQEGRTILFVSHNMGAITSLCSRCILLNKGAVVADGQTSKVIATYLSAVKSGTNNRVVLKGKPGLPAYISKIWIENTNGRRISESELGEDVILKIEYKIKQKVTGLVLATLVSSEGTPLLYSYDTDTNKDLLGFRKAGRYVSSLNLPTSMFKEGSYSILVQMGHAMENISDPEAVVFLEIANHQRDLTHYSYRKDRAGFIYKDIPWVTQLKD